AQSDATPQLARRSAVHAKRAQTARQIDVGGGVRARDRDGDELETGVEEYGVDHVADALGFESFRNAKQAVGLALSAPELDRGLKARAVVEATFPHLVEVIRHRDLATAPLAKRVERERGSRLRSRESSRSARVGRPRALARI